MNLALVEVVKNIRGVVLNDSFATKTFLLIANIIVVCFIFPLVFFVFFLKNVVGGTLRCWDYLRKNR